MPRYAGNVDAVRSLVRETEVHRDVYIDEEVFQLEMRNVFANAWVYVGHDSQTPNTGDFYGTTIGLQPVLMVRHTDGKRESVAQQMSAQGHAHHRRDLRQCGQVLPLPLPCVELQDRRLAARGPIAERLRKHRLRGQSRRRRNDGGSPCPQLSRVRVRQAERPRPRIRGILRGEPVEPRQHDRPLAGGRLEVAGGVLRYMHNCNWKMLVENQTDTCHPMVAHESSAGTAVEVWKNAPAGTPKPMAVEIYAPFMSSYEFFEKMGIRVWDNGHGHTGVYSSIHANYSAIPGYFEQMAAAYGEIRAKAILDENRHNTVYFPNLMVKGPIQLLRLFKPISANRTLVESWTFRLVDAPDALLERTLMYNRLINAPTSVVGHDDVEMYERAQEGLKSDGNPWVNLQRLYKPGEAEEVDVVTNGTSEWPMRNQFRAWAKFMTMSM